VAYGFSYALCICYLFLLILIGVHLYLTNWMQITLTYRSYTLYAFTYFWPFISYYLQHLPSSNHSVLTIAITATQRESLCEARPFEENAKF